MKFARPLLIPIIAGLLAFGLSQTWARASTPPTVAYVGDSTMVGEQPFLPAGATVLAWPGIDMVHAYAAWSAQLAADPPDVVVISLGLNDRETGFAFLLQVAQWVSVFPTTTKLVWLDPVTSPTCTWPGYTPDVVNAKSNVIDYVASFHSNMVAEPWHPLPEWFTPEGIHYTPTGYQARADLFQAEVNKTGA